VTSSPFVIKFPNGVKQISVLDYIFNPCQVISIEFAVNIKQYRDYFTNITRQNPLFININFDSSVVISTQVASFQASSTGHGVSSYAISALLMPIGVGDPSSDNFDKKSVSVGSRVKSNLSPNPSYLIKSFGGESTGHEWSPSADYGMKQSDSVLSGIMGHRKLASISGYGKFLTTTSSGLWHRLLYLFFGATANVTGTLSAIKSSYAAFADIDFTQRPSSSKNFFSIVPDGGDLTVSCKAGSQGIANSAFSYTSRLSNSYGAIINNYVNETYTITFSGKKPGGLTDFMFPVRESYFTDSPSFSGFVVDSPPDAVPTPWPKNTNVRHLKTLFTWTDDGTMGGLGNTTQFMFGRLNTGLVPHGS